jgi:hypothetical protein
MKRSMRHRNEWIKRPMGDDRRPEDGDAVAEFIDRLRSESTSDGPAPEGLARLLAAEARSAAQIAPARPSSGRIGPLPARKWRKPAMISAFLSTLLGKLTVAGVALAASTSGLAATGNLPDPAQAWASEALSNIGIEIPDPNDVELADQAHQADGVEVSEVEAPVLPEDAADTAKDVTNAVFEGDPSDGREYGESVADAAKGDNAVFEGDPSDGREYGESVADEHTEDAGSRADDNRSPVTEGK